MRSVGFFKAKPFLERHAKSKRKHLVVERWKSGNMGKEGVGDAGMLVVEFTMRLLRNCLGQRA